MSVLEPPLINRSHFSPSDDELDGLLRSFFREELPHSWPALTPPAPAVVPLAAAPTLGLSRSRVALAASVALLLGGQAWLSHSFQEEETPTENSAAGLRTARPDVHGPKAHRNGSVPATAKNPLPRALPPKPMR